MSNLVAHDPIATISAGGIAAIGAKPATDQRTSPVAARAYSHPALEAGKVVVRLEPDAVALGTDAEMAAFGFSSPKVTKPLGQVRHRTLGFPAWALVNEPKKAKAALDVTEPMRKAKRMVSAKPGHAKDAFEKIAKQLQRTAPSFLPSFWEEVGRVVADQASASMAAQCFERARQAERAYKLKIDPEHADAAFVEFALLGALSAKTLTTYAKDLTKSEGGSEAYRRFRAITVKRALGGMPPYSGMGKDLRALAKEAELDGNTEDEKLAAELIEAPGVNKAPIEFWTTYRDALVRLGTANVEVRNRLRVIWPEPRGGTDETREAFTETWMAMLDEIGAFADVPEDGLGAWVSRMIKFAGKTPLVERVLRENAERLVKLEHKIQVVAKAGWGTDLHLDLAEMALGLGIALADPGEYEDFSSDTMTCDPVLVAGHAVYGKKLVESVASMIGNSEHEHRMRGKAGFTAARRRWLEDNIAEIEGKGFLQVQESLATLDRKTTAETFLAFPDLHERLTKIDLAASLANHLRTGIADEFGWPAYEEAAGQLGKPVKTGGAFPIMTVWNPTKVIALGATGVVAEHDFVYKVKEHKLEDAWFLDGQFLIDLEVVDEYDNVQYWSGRPKEKFERKGSFSAWGGNLPNQWSPPEGGVTCGGKLFHAGDKEVSDSHDFLCDGKQMWHQSGEKYVLYDPVKGAKGTKADEPAFVSEFRREGWSVDAVLVPAPEGLANSPLGLKDGLLGIRHRDKKDDDDDKFPREHERIDGVEIKMRRSSFGLLTFPGDPVPRPIDVEDANNARFLGGSGPGVELLTAEHVPERMCIINQDEWASRGWGDVLVPPAAFWDYLTPRDEAGSGALRSITIDTSRTILDAARRDVEAGGAKSGREMPQTEAAIREALPAVTNAKLVRGIAGVAERAAELAKQAVELADDRAKDKADPGGAGLLGEAAQLRKLAAAMAAGKEGKIADFEVDPRSWLKCVRGRAVLSLSPLADADARRKTREMIQALAGSIFAEDLSRMRYFDIEAPDDWENSDDWDTLVLQKHENSLFAIHPSNDWAIELSSDGTFRAPPVAGTSHTWKVGDETRLGKGIGTAWADRFLESPDEGLAWDPAIGEKLAAAADLSVAEAILLWINVSDMSTYSKDFLGKKQRELLGGLKVGDADAAKTTFEELGSDKMFELFDKAAPDDPALLRTPLASGGMVERLGAAWKAKFGKRTKIPQDLIAGAKKDLDLGDELGKLLPAFAGAADDAGFLKPDLRPLNDLGGWGDDKGLTNDLAKEVATMVSWLFYARPIGCPIRAGIPAVIAKLTSIVDDERLVWPFESQYLDDDDPKEKKRAEGIVEAVGGKPVDMPKDGSEDCVSARDDGTCVVAYYKSNVYAGFRPAKLDHKTRKKVEQLGMLMNQDSGNTDDGLMPVRRIDMLRSAEFQAFGTRVGDTEVPEGGYEANPLQSVPKLVAKVAKALAISDDAAALYLQTLALAEPTQARVQLWNGWKPKQYTTAAAELVKKKLVTEGKRERAGRTIFIKGGYSKGEGKNLPMEEWKQPFYVGLERHLAAEPAHLLFARAWKRVEDGDKPA
ncbi:MAG: hypothetical protein ABI867_22605 [Kofleriaceae bacterium]